MPRTKKIYHFLFSNHYHFLVQKWHLMTICIWYRNCATCNYKIRDSRHEDYTNKQHGVLQLYLDT